MCEAMPSFASLVSSVLDSFIKDVGSARTVPPSERTERAELDASQPSERQESRPMADRSSDDLPIERQESRPMADRSSGALPIGSIAEGLLREPWGDKLGHVPVPAASSSVGRVAS